MSTNVNQQVANNLLQLRQKVDQYRVQIDQHRAAPDSSMGEEAAAKMFYGPVSSFLAQAEPILSDETAPGDEILDEVRLGTVTVNPPPIEPQIKAPGGLDPRADEIAAIRNRYTDEKIQYKLSKNSDLPQPVTRPVKGIRPILEQNSVSASWTVEITSQRVGSSMETVGVGDLGKSTTISNTKPWPVGVLYRAVRETTKALQNAGIGFKTGEQSSYDRRGGQ